MSIENHVVSLELAKELKELGYPQRGCQFYLGEFGCGIELFHSVDKTVDGGWLVAAPLATELLEWMPDRIEVDGTHIYRFRHTFSYWSRCHCVFYYPIAGGTAINGRKDTSFSNALAESLIWLVKNGRVDFNKEERDRNGD